MNRRDFLWSAGAITISAVISSKVAAAERSTHEIEVLEELVHSVAISGRVRRTRRGVEAIREERDIAVRFEFPYFVDNSDVIYEVVYKGQLVFRSDGEKIVDVPGVWESRAEELYQQYYSLHTKKI